MPAIEPILIITTVFWPLLLAAALLRANWRQLVIRLLPLAPLPALLLSLLPNPDFDLIIPWLLLGTQLGIDSVSSVFLLFTSILWIAGSLILPQKNPGRFAAWYLLTMTGSFAVLLAREIPGFFLGYAMMSLSIFGLVIHEMNTSAKSAAKIYLVFAVTGEAVLLAALLMVAQNAGTIALENVAERTPQHLLMALLLIGFGLKAGLPLLHMALPPTYVAMPLAAAVPVAGGLLHLGLYGWIRFLPFGQIAVPVWDKVFIATGLLAIVFGIGIGLTQRKSRSLLAYSSISQMGLMTLLIGIGLSAPDYWPQIQATLLLFVLHHALAKGALFYGLSVNSKHRIGLWLPALSLAGLPFMGGAVAKAQLKTQALLLAADWSIFVQWFLSAGSIGTTLLMARYLHLVYRQDSSLPGSTMAWWLLLSAMFLLPWTWPLQIELSTPITSALWPVVCGAVIAWFVYKGGLKKLLTKIPVIPPGDFLVFAVYLSRQFMQPGSAHVHHRKELNVILHPKEAPSFVTAPERILGRWAVAVILLLVVITTLFLVFTTTSSR